VTARGREMRRLPTPPRRRWLVRTAVVILLTTAAAALALTVRGYLKPAGFKSASTRPGSSSSTSSTLAQNSTTVVSASYSAALSGKSEVPPVTSSASGTLTLNVAHDGSSVDYVLRVSHITDLTVARLHEGSAGATGPTILTLYDGATKTGLFAGVLAQGSFSAAQFVGPLAGKTIADFVALVKSGQVYLNVGTSAHIQGEIRGQAK
jgi:hypothetical protein